jgi:hypothetical protein
MMPASFALLLLLVLLPAIALANTLPTKPQFYASRTGPLPIWSWTFREFQCSGKTIAEDAIGQLSLSMGTNASCPTRTPNTETFSNAINGVNVGTLKDQGALISGQVTSDTVAMNAFGSTGNLTVEIFFTKKAGTVGTNTYYLFEIANAYDGSAGTIGSNQWFFMRMAGSTFTVGAYGNYASGTNALTTSPSFSGNAASLSNLTELTSGNSGINQMYYAAIVMTAGANQKVDFYLSKVGYAFNPSSTGGSTFPVPYTSQAWPNPSYIRVGATYDGQVAQLGLPAEYHLVNVYNQALSQATLLNHFQAGIPNSNPAVTTTFIHFINEDTVGTVNLTNPATYYDADGNVPYRFFAIAPLPSSGTFYVNGTLLTVGTAFYATDNITFQQGTPNQFSVGNRSATTCAIPYATLSYKADDNLCDGLTTPGPNANTCLSVATGIIKVCIREVDDAPTVVPIASTVRVGSFSSFQIVPVDVDDNTRGLSDLVAASGVIQTSGVYSALIAIKFGSTNGSFGMITKYSASLGCQSNVQAALSPATESIVNSSLGFTFCYQVRTFAPEEIAGSTIVGTDVFNFSVADSDGLYGPVSNISFTVTNPIESCSPGAPALTGTVPNPPDFYGRSGTCSSHGNELGDDGSGMVPIYLQGFDQLLRYQNMTYEITMLPNHGSLYLSTGTAPNFAKFGSALAMGSNVTAVATNSAPNLLYVGNPYFYTDVLNRDNIAVQYSNLNGLGIDGCKNPATPNGGCPCANLTSGCPDFFQYRTVITVNSQVSKSSTGTYWVAVDSRPSVTGMAITGPDSIALNQGDRYNFNNSAATSVQVVDYDDSMYMVGVQINANSGQLSLHSSAQGRSDFHIDDCDQQLELGCSDIQFHTYLSNVNNALSSLQFVATSKLRNVSEAILIRVFKPYVTGVTQYSNTPQVSKTIYLYPASVAPASTAADTVGIAIIAGASAAGFLVLVCFIQLLIWCCNRGRRVVRWSLHLLCAGLTLRIWRQARAARMSMQSRQSGGVASIKDYEDPPPRGFGFCQLPRNRANPPGRHVVGHVVRRAARGRQRAGPPHVGQVHGGRLPRQIGAVGGGVERIGLQRRARAVHRVRRPGARGGDGARGGGREHIRLGEAH